MTALRTLNLTKRYPTGTVGVNGLDLEVPAGDRLALLGPSGSGKSTLLRLVAGLETPDAGEIHIDGRRVDAVPPHLRGVGLLPQRPALYPHLTVRENLEVPRKYSPQAHARPSVGLDPFRIAHLLDRRPHQLSGGERQRVALARLAARTPSLWLLDEPFSPLDPVLRAEFRHDLHLLLESADATILLVTHDPIDALALGRRVGVLGDGRLDQLGTPEDLRRRPRTRFVALALGQFSFLDGRLTAASGRAGGGDSPGPVFRSGDGSVEVEVPGYVRRYVASQPTPNLALGIRSEDVFPVPPGTPAADSGPRVEFNGWPVVLAEPVGSGWRLTLARGGSRVQAGWPAGSPPPVGDPVHWYTPVSAGVWFDAAGRRIPSDTE